MASHAAPTLLYRRVESLVLLAHAPLPPDTDEWTSYVLDLEAAGREHPDEIALLVLAEGLGPSAAQREQLRKHAPRKIRTSVVTTSAAARTIVTLLGWVTPSIRAFSPANIGGALDHLSVSPDSRPAILRQAAALRAQVAGVGVNDDEAAMALLDGLAIEPMLAIQSPLSALRSELLSRRRS